MTLIGRVRTFHSPGIARTPNSRSAGQAIFSPVRESRVARPKYCQKRSSPSYPTVTLLFARSKLLVALSEKLDQTVHAALLDLVAELLPICLNQPDAQHVYVI